MSGAAGEETVQRVWEALRVVIDPELGYNIVDLGLIYDVDVNAEGAAHIMMTTTTRGCPATHYLQTGAYEAALSTDDITSAEVEMTYDPPWNPGMMRPEAKAHFGIPDD
ncbi:aromatic ring hydroxylase [Steroidobacter denitrificans]|uniref:Aromatic ring hydroxylase n=1 Tax=Steroidobacter denitrificans TaxID=465721 RepID=A0A127FED6_STEDE|nr:metal-sulfur cluster assembly factor [Steroidobacter denitrificans]AMN48300.1 aromatic ring hydroxylase [Steroidobacter denitrificans]